METTSAKSASNKGHVGVKRACRRKNTPACAMFHNMEERTDLTGRKLVENYNSVSLSLSLSLSLLSDFLLFSVCASTA